MVQAGRAMTVTVWMVVCECYVQWKISVKSPKHIAWRLEL